MTLHSLTNDPCVTSESLIGLQKDLPAPGKKPNLFKSLIRKFYKGEKNKQPLAERETTTIIQGKFQRPVLVHKENSFILLTNPLDKVLSKGGFKEIRFAIETETNEVRALAVADLSRSSEIDYTSMKKETEIMNLFKGSSRVVQLLAEGKTSNNFYFVMDYSNGGDLADAVRNKKTCGWEDIIATQICEGISQIHGLGIAHRDLNPSNVLMHYDQNKKPSIRIADFGLSTEANAEETQYQVVGRERWYSPEEAINSFLTPLERAPVCGLAADIWSTGLIIYNLFEGKVMGYQLKQNPANELLSMGAAGLEESLEESQTFINSKFFALVSCCMLLFNPAERGKASDIFDYLEENIPTLTVISE